MIKPNAKLYLTFVNDFLTVAGFSEWLEVSVEQATSIIARSKIMWLSEDKGHRTYFTNNCINLCEHYNSINPNNAKVFANHHAKNLLAEYSA
ncbi:hypothetical protein NVP1161O_112 [Vibrio phage 1.161.O._10N.261.48.C5]|nr:hypothetical protein NVP1161O_112 [Vibrio phage 1.161.O._10N.261.48.C5]